MVVYFVLSARSQTAAVLVRKASAANKKEPKCVST